MLLTIHITFSWWYRCVPLIRSPNLDTTCSPKWRGGLYSNMQLVSGISPPLPTKVYVSATYTSKVQVYIRTQHSTQNSWYRIENTVRGHHIYKASGLPTSEKSCQFNARSIMNIHDDFAVAVLKNSSTVGHVPRDISRVCWYFLHKSGSKMTCSHKLTKDSLYSMHLQRKWARVVNIFQKTLTGGAL